MHLRPRNYPIISSQSPPDDRGEGHEEGEQQENDEHPQGSQIPAELIALHLEVLEELIGRPVVAEVHCGMALQFPAIVSIDGPHQALKDVPKEGHIADGSQEPGQLVQPDEEAGEEEEGYCGTWHQEYGQLHGE